MADQRNIIAKVSELEGMVFGSSTDFLFLGSEKKDYRAMWTLVREIGAMFKGSRFDTREKRQETWDKFQAAVQRLKEDRDEHSQKMDALRSRSSRHLAHIEAMLPLTRDGDGFANLIVAIATGGASIAIDKGLDLVMGESDQELERLKAAGQVIHDSGQYLSENKREMIGPDKSEAFERIKRAREILDKEWAEYKGRRQQLRGEHQERIQRSREEKRAKHDAWRLKTEAWVSKQEAWVSKMEGVIANKQANIDKLEGQIADAWSDDFKDRARGWVQDDEEAIADIRSRIEETEDRFNDARARLRDSVWN